MQTNYSQKQQNQFFQFFLMVLLSGTASVFSQNTPPLLESNFTIDYYENSGPVFIHPGITLTDPDSATMSEAHVDSDEFSADEGTDLIANPATMGDIYGDSYGSVGWFDVLSDGGAATIEQWQAALRAVTYTNTSDDFPAGQRLYSYSIIDDTGEYSNTVIVTINMIPINDAPFRTAGSVNPLTVTEDDPSASLGLSAVDYSAFEPSQTLTYTVTQIPLASIGSITLADGMTVVAAGNYTLEEIQGMKFLPAPNGSGITSFSYVANDGGGTSNGGIDSITETIAITVNAVNDAPILDASANLAVTVNQDAAAPTGSVGSTVNSFTGGISDVDGDAKGIAVISNNQINGNWYYTTDNGANWILVGATTSSNALLLTDDANTRLYFRPAPGFSGTMPSSLTIRAWDNSVGLSGTRTAISATGGSTAFSDNTDNISVTVMSTFNLPVNMNPSYANTTLASFSTAIPAVPYTYAPSTNLKYRFSITNLTTGVTAPDIVQASYYVTIPASIHYYGASYSIKASAVIDDTLVAFSGNKITVNGPTIQLVTLSSASCGSTLPSLTTTISANAGLNATGYTFRIRLNDGNPTPTYAYSQSASRFVSANSFTGFPLQYNSSYKVAVQYTFTNPVTNMPEDSGYGAECTVNTASIPLIGLAAPVCGSQFTAMNANISATAAPYATAYRFRIRLFSDNGPTPNYFYSLPNAGRFSSMTAFQGIALTYNTAYAISVEYSILEGGNAIWSGYGSECKLTTPFFPTTSLVPSQCGQATATSLAQQLNIIPYPGFPNYKVKLEEVSGEDITNSQEIIVSYPYFRLNQFSIAQIGKNYNVSVAIKLNGVFGNYDTACDINTFSGDGTDWLKTTIFKATAYPNPFADNFMLDLKTTNQSTVGIKVYDMLGRLIDQRNVRVSDVQAIAIGTEYPTGVYNVIVSQDGKVETIRVVKR